MIHRIAIICVLLLSVVNAQPNQTKVELDSSIVALMHTMPDMDRRLPTELGYHQLFSMTNDTARVFILTNVQTVPQFKTITMPDSTKQNIMSPPQVTAIKVVLGDTISAEVARNLGKGYLLEVFGIGTKNMFQKAIETFSKEEEKSIGNTRI